MKSLNFIKSLKFCDFAFLNSLNSLKFCFFNSLTFLISAQVVGFGFAVRIKGVAFG